MRKYLFLLCCFFGLFGHAENVTNRETKEMRRLGEAYKKTSVSLQRTLSNLDSLAFLENNKARNRNQKLVKKLKSDLSEMKLILSVIGMKTSRQEKKIKKSKKGISKNKQTIDITVKNIRSLTKKGDLKYCAARKLVLRAEKLKKKITKFEKITDDIDLKIMVFKNMIENEKKVVSRIKLALKNN